MSRVYFHIDLNAFYANAECLLDPTLRGKPLAVSGQTRRSVVSTASYEARAYGVHSAMPIAEAKNLCRDLVVVAPHFNYYEELSNEFIAIVRSYTSIVEQASIDECYADMTDAIFRFPRPLDLAFQLQHRVRDELGLPCSIGIGPNLFLAKMASDMKKPMGITVLRIREVPQKLWPLKIADMRGVGKKTLPFLEELGIRTIGDLAQWKDPEQLRGIFGKNTEQMIARANGHDDRQIELETDPKSMGVSETFLEDVTDYDELRGMMRTLSRRLSKRLAEVRKTGSLVSIRIRYSDFSNADRSMHVDHPIWKADDLFEQGIRLFNENWEQDPVRLLGLTLSEFHSEQEDRNLFNLEESEKEATASILSDLNEELGGLRLKRASALLKEHHED
ncbi:DNA polymerase IV [Erysipelotrichaceae bacterium Oil+RF-744-GAM-WT-6]|jgi:DNA polymerase-4|uniref:DNA polymerase IV n=1 Tax=Stecheria intestinalis TaxID=2606630 RepID=A0A7X2TF81_9FIRM|nr:MULTISPECIES: DNA polymerase IV [Erysipelotrichaceae]MDY3234534.1 DNA polymerase IV [Erysipelotrichaceae bacterium]MDY4682458.1 DNA polymerase IV [Lachnospiraceae bacterium]MCI6746417.1 DNA polymerase IV [Anaerolactibacter massiliensis]MDD5880591.1 DNA polymerase IV [Stecheria intestinalis]MDD7681007.1 DNA polymerase IV [Stecheria intestinalis]